MYKLNYLDYNNQHVHKSHDDVNYLKKIVECAYADSITIDWAYNGNTYRAYVNDELVGWIHN